MNKNNIPIFQFFIIPCGFFYNFWKKLIIRNLFFAFLVFLFSVSEIFAQPKTNLDVFYILVDSSVNQFISQLTEAEDSIELELNLGESYSIFENKIIAGLYSSGKFIAEKNKNARYINYIINDAKVEYGEIFRDGFFGDYYIPRKIFLKGNYLVKTNSAFFKEFNYSFNDTIKYDEINNVENDSYPFTKGDIPSEPFFSGLFEPVVAIGTAALAVILFFTIRSK
jgi:hypothetical protein